MAVGYPVAHPLCVGILTVGTEFNIWLLVVGVVAGGALTWLVLAELNRRDEEIGERELIAEAGWLAGAVDDPRLDPALAEAVLRAHRRYLGYPPPDALVSPDDLTVLEPNRGEPSPGRDG